MAPRYQYRTTQHGVVGNCGDRPVCRGSQLLPARNHRLPAIPAAAAPRTGRTATAGTLHFITTYFATSAAGTASDNMRHRRSPAHRSSPSGITSPTIVRCVPCCSHRSASAVSTAQRADRAYLQHVVSHLQQQPAAAAAAAAAIASTSQREDESVTSRRGESAPQDSMHPPRPCGCFSATGATLRTMRQSCVRCW